MVFVKNIFVTLVLCLFPVVGSAQVFPQYEMQGAFTDLWPRDVDYFSPPIELLRTSETFERHFISFQVARYVPVCTHAQRVCVRRDRQGRCLAWQQRCVRWAYRQVPVDKRLQIHFRDLPELSENEIEVYRLDIMRQRPVNGGEDLVRTRLTGSETKSEVRIRRHSDFRYTIERVN